ncbi:PRD domain-containing protein [Bacillus megaterium]|nr:PRD domain-containing protein [Priestia megaterium]
MITKPLNDIKNLMETAKDGDFQVQGTYESKDEIGLLTASFNKMIGGLKEMIMSVGNISSTVAASSEELSASAEQNNSAIEHISSMTEKLASGSNHQVNQIQESSTIIHRITNQTSEVVENVEQITKRALDTAAISNSGTATVETAAKQMKSINENVTELSSVFQGLSEHSAKISQINDVITTIADQTNLQGDKELYTGLLMHIKPMVNRLKYQINIKNPLLEEIKHQYSATFGMTWLVCSIIERKLNVKVNEDEIGYVTLHFQAAIERCVGLKRAIVVCPGGIGTSQLIANRIKRLIPQLEIAEVISLSRLSHFDLSNIDFIISTVPLHIEVKPVITISSLVSEVDIKNINNFFWEDTFSKKRSKYNMCQFI